MSDLAERLCIARWKLIEVEPLVGFLAQELPTVVAEEDELAFAQMGTEGSKTAYTDYEKYVYCRPWCESLSQQELNFVVAHETMHVLLKHKSRKQDYHDNELSNIAMDIAINLMLEYGLGKKAEAKGKVMRAVVQPPTFDEGQICYDEKYLGWDWESIYENIRGTSRDLWYCFDPLTSNIGGKAARDPAQSSKQEVAIERAIARAFSKSQAHRARYGMQPSEMDRIAEGIFKPHKEWHKELRAYMKTKGRSHVSWRKPKKKYLGIPTPWGSPIMMPVRNGLDIGTLVAIVDTSGSIGSLDLGRFVSELNALLQGHKTVTLHLWTCDTIVHEVGVYDHYNRIPDDTFFPGGGGTDFRPAFEKVEQLRKKAPISHLIYLTDTWGAFPDEKPTYPVLWIAPDECTQTIPFGKLIVLN